MLDLPSDARENESSIDRLMTPYSIAVALILIWLLGVTFAVTFHGFIHLLLAIAVVLLLVRTVSRKEKH